MQQALGRLAAVLGAVGLALSTLALSACTGHQGGAGTSATSSSPATAVAIAGTDVKKVVLTADAAKRVGIETAPVSRIKAASGTETVIPVSAVYYDGNGGVWVYTNPAPLQYIRASVTLGDVTGDTAVLRAGPPVGTLVVTVGEAELYGVEYGVGGEQ